jgi:hypothetical protein
MVSSFLWMRNPWEGWGTGWVSLLVGRQMVDEVVPGSFTLRMRYVQVYVRTFALLGVRGIGKVIDLEDRQSDIE